MKPNWIELTSENYTQYGKTYIDVNSYHFLLLLNEKEIPSKADCDFYIEQFGNKVTDCLDFGLYDVFDKHHVLIKNGYGLKLNGQQAKHNDSFYVNDKDFWKSHIDLFSKRLSLIYSKTKKIQKVIILKFNVETIDNFQSVNSNSCEVNYEILFKNSNNSDGKAFQYFRIEKDFDPESQINLSDLIVTSGPQKNDIEIPYSKKYKKFIDMYMEQYKSTNEAMKLFLRDIVK